VTLAPAPADHGVVFVRTDLPGRPEIPAKPEFVVDTSLATSLGKDGARVGTVEHLLSALTGMGVDNVCVEINGPEVPIVDGSAAPFCFLIRNAGLVSQRKLKRFMVIKRTVEVRDGDKVARLVPSNRFSVSCTIDFQHPLISNQSYRMDFSGREFDREISRARTFGFLRDVEKLKTMGLARGGSLENAIVVDDFSILNPDGLRFPDEFVRHKILDAVGDLSLLGMPVVGHMHAYKSGHALNQKLVSTVLADQSSYSVVTAGKELERSHLEVPAFGITAEVA
jgi:UDP-3-O-[3-hydroxymyristoyl] N-acetylglucosamine deacetylase